MQVDVFALVTEARQRVASLRAAIEAKRDFFLAQSDLKATIDGGGAGGNESDRSTTTTAQAAESGH